MLEAILLDVDGVLTSGKKTYNHLGECISKEFFDQDFTAIKKFQQQGIYVAFLSADNFNCGVAAMRHIPFYDTRHVGGIIDKNKVAKKICLDRCFRPSMVLYVGDDYLDIPLMKVLGYPNCFCPQNSPREVKKHAITIPVNGGDGVVMRLFEVLLGMGVVKDVEVNT